jgi:hypothetical protein
MSVAPSFQKLELAGEPFAEGDKEYVYVRYPDGHTRKVRWYEETPKRIRSVKDVLGFKEGYITIIKGDVEPVEEWLRRSTARFHKYWGWYFVSEEEVPQMPYGIEAVKLYWKDIAVPGQDDLLTENRIREHVASLIFEPSPSKFQGSIGERIDRTLTVIKAIPLDGGKYGPSTFYLFEDQNKNEYCWTTSSKTLEPQTTYKIRGTVKEYQKYKGKEQTVLTRCKVN